MKRPHRYSQPSSRRGTVRLGAVIAILVGINLYVFLWRGGTSIPDVMEKAAVAGESGALMDAAAVPESSEPALPSPDGVVVKGAVESGDSMGRILRREGLSANEADELIRALNGTLDFRKIRAGQTFEMQFDGDKRLIQFDFEISRLIRVRVTRGSDGKLSAKTIEAQTDIRREELGGAIQGSLYKSIKRAGEQTSLVSFFVDVFAYDINFYVDTHPGDAYRLIVEKEYLDGDFLGYGRVLAAEYDGKTGIYRAFWWKSSSSKDGKYYNEKGQAVEKTFLKTPLKFARVSSGFNPKRMHPVLHVRKGHWGTDYAAPPGTPIWSAAPGRITYRDHRGGAGNCVIVNHENGYQTTYMHMSKFKAGQSVGTRVRAKDVIGYVGSTGLATGPHLHFGVKKNGHYVDPQKMKMSRGAGVAKKDMPRFKSDMSALVATLADIPAELPRANPFIVQLSAVSATL